MRQIDTRTKGWHSQTQFVAKEGVLWRELYLPNEKHDMPSLKSIFIVFPLIPGHPAIYEDAPACTGV